MLCLKTLSEELHLYGRTKKKELFGFALPVIRGSSIHMLKHLMSQVHKCDFLFLFFFNLKQKKKENGPF